MNRSMRAELEKVIKSEIESVFGRRIISSRDCIALSDEIYQRTQNQLNPNTLRRFFGLVKASYPASNATLNILSKYCGFTSTEDIYQIKQKETEEKPEVVEHKSLLYYLISLFQDAPVSGKCDKTFLSLVKHTIKFLEFNPALTDKFQGLVAKTKNGQDFYFEQFVNIDKLNSYFDNGLRYYMNEKPTPEAKLLVNAIQVYKYWLKDNTKKTKEFGEQIQDRSLIAGSSFYISSRYYAALLFHAHVSGYPVEEILIDIYKLYSTFTETHRNNEALLYFEYVLSEALVLTGHYNDALYYLGQFQKKEQFSDSPKYTVSGENVKLLKAIAHFKTGNIQLADTIFNDIKPSGFLFILKNFSGILYMYLATELKRKNIRYNESFHSLIHETGFLRFRSGI